MIMPASAAAPSRIFFFIMSPLGIVFFGPVSMRRSRPADAGGPTEAAQLASLDLIFISSAVFPTIAGLMSSVSAMPSASLQLILPSLNSFRSFP
jgi:hypothetical protein